MRQISRQIVGDNLKRELAPFSFMLPSGGEEIKRAPLMYYSRADCLLVVMNTIIHRMQHIHKCNGMKSLK